MSAKKKVSRRGLLGRTAVLAAGVASARAFSGTGEAAHAGDSQSHYDHVNILSTVGQVDLSEFNPTDFLRHFDYGKVSRLPDGRTLREWEVYAVDRDIEIAPGVFFPAWTFNGQVPGPTFRCTEGDLMKIRFINAGSHPHTMHFHGFHPADMDGVFEVVEPGGEFLYEFDADPFGLHLYHCHTVPLKRHIHKGLYGAVIIDPKAGRPPADEMVMVMNGFDTDFDEENEVYAVNTVAFHHHHDPIRVKLGELVRIYVVNILEFDLINSIHIHGHFFDVYRTGTKLEPDEFTDTVMMCQGERHILELKFRFPGKFMFHAHQSEFAELGWMGFFDVEA